MNHRILTTKKILKKPKDNVVKGSPLNYNAAQQLRYKRALLDLTKTMILEVKNRIIALFKKSNSKEFFQHQAIAAEDESIASQAKKLTNSLLDKFEQLFNRKSTTLANQMLNGSKSVSESSLKTSLRQLSGGLTLNTGVVPAGMEDVSKSIINENVNLIKSIPSEYLSKISTAVMASITTGNGLQDLIPAIQKYSGQTERRINNLALDQTRKAYNFINKQRMQSLGVKKFEWLHSGGGQHPRKSHMAISGNIYSFDDLPLKGEEGFSSGQIPGQAINCRCKMIPVFEFED